MGMADRPSDREYLDRGLTFGVHRPLVTQAGRELLRKARTTDGWHTNFDEGDIRDIEYQAQDWVLDRERLALAHHRALGWPVDTFRTGECVCMDIVDRMVEFL